MLDVIGENSIDEFYADIPETVRLSRPLDLPGPLTEPDLIDRMAEYAGANKTAKLKNIYLGAGSYPHHTPVAVGQLLLRSEFFTAYTPYQPEISQGTLMAIFEFQTYTAALFGVDIANASMYDGATALAEAVIMAQRITKKPKVVMSDLVHPHSREVAATYTQHMDEEIVTIDSFSEGIVTEKKLDAACDDKTSAIVVSYPNFLGNIEDLKAARKVCDRYGALLIVACPEPMALGILKAPGAFGADIVVGEGNSFGGSLSYGGPGVGMFGTCDKWTRQMPGRLVGKTKDIDGRDGYVLTLATREQHIRRERATSNICSNQALCATAMAIHLSLLGKSGLKDIAVKNLSAARYLLDQVTSLEGFTQLYDKPFFNEVAIETPVEPTVINKRLAEEGIVGGYDLSGVYAEASHAALFCATDVHSKKSIDRLVEVLREFVARPQRRVARPQRGG